MTWRTASACARVVEASAYLTEHVPDFQQPFAAAIIDCAAVEPVLGPGHKACLDGIVVDIVQLLPCQRIASYFLWPVVLLPELPNTSIQLTVAKLTK